MKIIFFGDSITDASRARGSNDAGRVHETYSDTPRAYGSGYVCFAAAELFYEKPHYYEILNRGIGGDRLPQIYARINLDVWSENPDVLSILIGANDVNTGSNPNCTDLERWGRLYRMLIRDTQERFPNIKLMICEPFSLRDAQAADENHPFNTIHDYAAEAKKVAEEFNLPFVALQDKMDEAARVYGVEAVCYDRVHPNLVGSKVIAAEWLRVFREHYGNC